MGWTLKDIPDQTGRVALVTGANSGLGLETSRALLQKGATVLMACRSQRKSEAARRDLLDLGTTGVDLLDLDLSDLNSVERCANAVQERYGRLDLLMNNAGLMAPPRRLSVQGFEMQFAVNHLGHMALTQRLLPLMEGREDARVVTVTSGAQYFGKMQWSDLQGERRYDRWKAYSQSKLANVMFALELNHRLHKQNSTVISLAAHPGLARTNLQPVSVAATGAWQESLAYRLMDPLFQSAAMGALPQLHAATASRAKGGEHFGPGGFASMRGMPTRQPVARPARDGEQRERLWRISDDMILCNKSEV
ncbi:oxidoreductase [Synechococcus sp. Cu2B8-bc1011]|uniref:oxidoreductase n=1 Tax=Synechococcus sp. Cu2B8-bc1011 TaxID=3093725 RepID=UPI0039B1008F